jgi:L-2-hydroxyglutarate oxidase
MQIVGFRGDYYELSEKAREKVKHLIYPVPDPRYPFLGIHFTPMIDGHVECGPNAVFTFKREGYSRTSFSLRDTLEALAYRGTWKLFMKNWEKGLEEYRRAFSQKLFLREARNMVPSLTQNEIYPTRSGVRAQAVGPEGEMVDDFVIIKNSGVTHVVNAPSPAATACLAIADEVLKKMDDTTA